MRGGIPIPTIRLMLQGDPFTILDYYCLSFWHYCCEKINHIYNSLLLLSCQILYSSCAHPSQLHERLPMGNSITICLYLGSLLTNKFHDVSRFDKFAEWFRNGSNLFQKIISTKKSA